MQNPTIFDDLMAAQADNPRRVVCLEVDGKQVWAKRAAKNYINPAQRLYAGLTASLSKSSSELIREEVACIEALRRRDVIVPEVLHVGADYFVLSDIGPSLQSVMQNAASNSERLPIVQKAAKALQALHEKGGWHGGATLRDMTMGERGIGFIDFENSSDPVIPLSLRHVRDLWMLGQSIAKFDLSGGLTAEMLKAYNLEKPKRLLLCGAIIASPVYLLLKPFGRSIGPDVAQITGCFQGSFRAARDLYGSRRH